MSHATIFALDEPGDGESVYSEQQNCKVIARAGLREEKKKSRPALSDGVAIFLVPGHAHQRHDERLVCESNAIL